LLLILRQKQAQRRPQRTGGSPLGAGEIPCTLVITQLQAFPVLISVNIFFTIATFINEALVNDAKVNIKAHLEKQVVYVTKLIYRTFELSMVSFILKQFGQVRISPITVGPAC
jgi:hypothetical protein